jgi:hypothetical protein
MADMMSQRELLSLFDALFEGRLESSEERRLAEHLRNDPAACLLYVRYADIHASLTQGSHFANPVELEQNSAPAVSEDQLARSTQAEVVIPLVRSEDVNPDAGSGIAPIATPATNHWPSMPFLAAGLLLLLAGTFIGGAIMRRIDSQRFDQASIVNSPAAPANERAHAEGAYVATLVNVTNCRWDQSHSTARLAQGSTLRSGESLHLLEGAAEINLTLKNGGVAALQLEGPLAMSMNSQGMPNLLYGHLTGLFTCDYDRFALDTPLGRVNVSSDASIGVIAAANKVELHVFTGSASLELWAMGVGGSSKQMTAGAGLSLSARVDSDGNISVEHGKAKEAGFLTPAARTASQLHISDKYVAAVKAAQPVAYWRFEGDVDGVMRNEVGDRLNCRIVGDAVRWHPGQEGSTVEFGATAGPGYLISDDTLGPQIESYSVEMWAKPNYFHHATLFSLLQWTAPESPVGKHRMALEICGPVSGLTSPYRNTDFHPGQIRFAQETQAHLDVDCYSRDCYAVRQWQYLVAVKGPKQIQLYYNGKLIASEEAIGPLPAGERVLMGQLLPVSPKVEDQVTSRLFCGELDEVAIYDRQLTESEIKQHFELVHSESDRKDNKSTGGMLP